MLSSLPRGIHDSSVLTQCTFCTCCRNFVNFINRLHANLTRILSFIKHLDFSLKNVRPTARRMYATSSQNTRHCKMNHFELLLWWSEKLAQVTCPLNQGAEKGKGSFPLVPPLRYAGLWRGGGGGGLMGKTPLCTPSYRARVIAQLITTPVILEFL